MFELTSVDTAEPPHSSPRTEKGATIDRKNTIYSKNTIEKSIISHFTSPCSRPIIFSGFAPLAEKLSKQYAITYIDSQKKPSLNTRKVVKGDVLEFIYFNASPCLVISSTTSADWHHSFQLDKLTKAIERNRYQLVLLEFYDDDAIKVNRSLRSDLNQECVEWSLKGITTKNTDYGHSVADIRGHSGKENREITAKLGIFNKQRLLSYFRKQLPGYEIECHSTLIPSDPSFTLSFKLKGNRYGK